MNVDISQPSEPFSVRRVQLEMKELDQNYFLTETTTSKRKFKFFESFEKTKKVSRKSPEDEDSFWG